MFPVVVRIFAYGSNMCIPHVGEWARGRGLDVPRILDARAAVLEEHALVWNYRSKRRGAGAANVMRTPGGRVHGVLLETDEAGLSVIDRKEGAPIRYARRLEGVRTGTETIEAWVYAVTEAYLEPPPVWPNRAYVELIIAGARAANLPRDYVAKLMGIPVVE